MSHRSRGPRAQAAIDMGRRAREKFDKTGELPRNPFIGKDRQLRRSWTFGSDRGWERE